LTAAKSCFKFNLGLATYDDQVKACNALHAGSDLAVITSQAEQDVLERYINSVITAAQKKTCDMGFYIGLGRKDREHCPAKLNSDWVWKSVALCDDPITYTNWLGGEPSGCVGKAAGDKPVESCGHIWLSRANKWNDLPCSNTLCGVCTITL